MTAFANHSEDYTIDIEELDTIAPAAPKSSTNATRLVERRLNQAEEQKLFHIICKKTLLNV